MFKLIWSRLKLYSFLLLFLVGVLLALWGYNLYVNGKQYTLPLGTENKQYSFTYEITKSWPEGAHGYNLGSQYDGVIVNRTSYAMKDWTIQLSLNGRTYLDSYWNGEFSADDQFITITSLDYNETVESEEEQPFGFVLYGKEEDNIASGYLTYSIDKKLSHYALFWMILVSIFIVCIAGITSIFYEIKNQRLVRRQQEYTFIINQSFITFANMIDAKDKYTKGHSQRVAFYSRELSRRLGFSEEEQQRIFYIALLHDIGKIGVSDAILKKNTKLTYDEFNEIKEHVSMGGDILKNFTAIKDIEYGARYHHERYDGNGYMSGLKGEEIPLLARIICVADSFDAMSSARCYRNALSKGEIIAEFERCSGTQFDPQIVPHILAMIQEGVAPIMLSDDELEKTFKLANLSSESN